MTNTSTPVRPTMPEGRVVHETLAGTLAFDSETDFKAWQAEPLWRKLLGRTERDRRRKLLGKAGR